jgi:5-methyltetrahydropteroyltriglutamate--homocysteine methyltransferase
MTIRTTVVGSWWLHPELEQNLEGHHSGKLSPEESRSVLNKAAARAIQEQRDLGLDEWTGGEYFADDFILHMHKCLTGLEVDKPKADYVFDYDDVAHAKVVGKITAPNGLGFAEAFRRENKLPGGVNKATVVSPFEVVFAAGRDQADVLGPQIPAVMEIVNRELRALADAGCPNVQLDAPIFSAEVNMGTMTAQQAADLIAPCFEGVKATRSLHFCNGNLRGRPISHALHCAPWVDILQRLDGVVDVAAFEVKYFFQYLERDAFKNMPKSMQLAAGIVDEATYAVEPVKKIRERIADWARVVGEERLWVSPSCGFGRHTSRDIPVLRAKVENMVEAARTL